MISISFNLGDIPLAQVLDSAKQLLRSSKDSYARVAVKQALTKNLYFIDMEKLADGSIQELIWTTGTISEDAKHNHGEGVDTATHQG